MKSLVALPKAHLHLHLEGALSLNLYRNWAPITFPHPTDFTDFTSFLDNYFCAMQLINSTTRLEEMLSAVFADARSQGVTWLELTISPEFYAANFNLSLEKALQLLLSNLHQASSYNHIPFGAILSADRKNPQKAEELARLAAFYSSSGVVAFGLANDERIGDIRDFTKAFDIARDAGLLLTPHAGELLGSQSVQSTLDSLHPQRLAHGVRSVEDPSLMARLASLGIACDLCPTSNARLIGLTEFPYRAFIKAGVPFTLNADDPLLLGVDINDEYELARTAGLSDKELANVARTSFTASGAPLGVVQANLQAIDKWESDDNA